MKTNKFIAKTTYGLEEVLAEELLNIGATEIVKRKRAVEFSCNMEILYKANMSLRTCLKILKPIHQFSANSPDKLYRLTKRFNWTSLISTGDTFAIDSVVNSEHFTHSKYAALKIKDAIVDQIREEKGKRPDIDIKYPTVRLNLHIDKQDCTISLDSSGDSLHKRGYRIKGGSAPLNEVIAAGLIKLSEWDCNSTFVDPMCGSGTILIEAVLMSKNIAPNLNRNNFAFMKWQDFNKQLFDKVRSDLISDQRELNISVIGNDISEHAIENAKINANAANVENDIELKVGNFSELNHEFNSGIIITNPPYDERLKHDNVVNFYKSFGDTLKNNFTGFDAWILSANQAALKMIGLRTSRRLMLYNGALQCKFHNYKLYKGSLKKKHEQN